MKRKALQVVPMQAASHAADDDHWGEACDLAARCFDSDFAEGDWAMFVPEVSPSGYRYLLAHNGDLEVAARRRDPDGEIEIVNWYHPDFERVPHA